MIHLTEALMSSKTRAQKATDAKLFKDLKKNDNIYAYSGNPLSGHDGDQSGTVYRLNLDGNSCEFATEINGKLQSFGPSETVAIEWKYQNGFKDWTVMDVPSDAVYVEAHENGNLYIITTSQTKFEQAMKHYKVKNY